MWFFCKNAEIQQDEQVHLEDVRLRQAETDK